MSRTFLRRVPYRRNVVCPCGQPLGQSRAAKKMRRCGDCIDRYARSAEPKPPWWQASLFGSDGAPSRRRAPAPRAAPPQLRAVPPPPAPAEPPKPTAVQLTAERVRRLEAARIRADHDPRLSLYLQLRADGVSRFEAEEQVDAAFSHGRNQDE